MTISQKKGGVILSYLSQLFGVLSGMLYTPYMLQTLGQSEYGLYSLVSSTVSVLGMLNLGFSGCYLYFFNKYSAEKDEKAVARFNATYFIIFMVIAALTLICGAFIYFNMELFFGDGLTADEYEKASILVAIMIANMATSLPITVFSSGINAHGKFIFENGYSLVSALLAVVINILVLACGFGSIGLSFVALAFTALKLIIFAIYGLRVLKMNFCFTGLQMAMVRTMFSFTLFIFLNQVINYLNGQLDKVLLGRFAGTAVVAIYSVGSSLNGYFQSFGSSIAGVFGPQINEIASKAEAEHQEEKGNAHLTDVFLKVSRMQVFVLMLVFTGFVLVGREFVILWAGEEYIESYYIAAILMLSGSVGYFQSVGETIQRAKFKHQVRSIAFLIMSVVNVCISIPLIMVAGAFGAAVGTTLVNIAGNWFFLNWYYYKKLHLEMKRYWKNILSILKWVVLVFICGIVIVNVMNVEGWIMLGAFVVIYSLLYCAVCWRFATNEEEKQMIKQLIPTKLRFRK